MQKLIIPFLILVFLIWISSIARGQPTSASWEPENHNQPWRVHFFWEEFEQVHKSYSNVSWKTEGECKAQLVAVISALAKDNPEHVLTAYCRRDGHET